MTNSSLKIFNDKIEFYNPGKLPEQITIEKLFLNDYSSYPRNKQIANICKDLGWIEKYGTGFGRICKLLKSYGLKLPHIENDGKGVKVTVFALIENVTENRMSLILNELKNNPHVSFEQLSIN